MVVTTARTRPVERASAARVAVAASAAKGGAAFSRTTTRATAAMVAAMVATMAAAMAAVPQAVIGGATERLVSSLVSLSTLRWHPEAGSK